MNESNPPTALDTSSEAAVPGQRVDKWLWYARFFKSRSLASRLCKGRKLRINRRVVEKASASVKVGDIVTFPQGNQIRAVQILEIGVRRGPASEAQLLYENLTPPLAASRGSSAKNEAAERVKGTGRPTKSDRRALDRLTRGN